MSISVSQLKENRLVRKKGSGAEKKWAKASGKRGQEAFGEMAGTLILTKNSHPSSCV